MKYVLAIILLTFVGLSLVWASHGPHPVVCGVAGIEATCGSVGR